jgi:hypothetical protein
MKEKSVVLTFLKGECCQPRHQSITARTTDQRMALLVSENFYLSSRNLRFADIASYHVLNGALRDYCFNACLV